jgi:hypothetical protein
MNDSRDQLIYESINQKNIINSKKPARSDDDRDAARRHERVCDFETDCNNGSVSNETTALSRIMKDLKEERKSQVRLSKRCKVRFRKNSLWDKSQRNGKVICIEPKDYQKLGYHL